MAVTSGFYNSLDGDRTYNAEEMSAIFDGIINDGILATIGNCFAVASSSGNVITVDTGRAWFDSIWIYNDSKLSIEASDSEVLLDRYDAVIIEVNKSDDVRAASIYIIEGTPASSPAYPTLESTEYITQYVLAYIYREGGSDSITASDITNMIGSDETPFVTGILEVISLTDLLGQWEGDLDDFMSEMENTFYTWFSTLQTALEDDVATNLLNMILNAVSIVTVTVPASGWVLSGEIYTQTVAVSSISEDDNPLLVRNLDDGATADEQEEYNEAFAILSSGTGTTSDGYVTFNVYDLPETTISVGLRLLGSSEEEEE